MKQWTQSEKEKIVKYGEEHGPTAAARHFGVSTSQYYNWKNSLKKNKQNIQETGPKEESSLAGADVTIYNLSKQLSRARLINDFLFEKIRNTNTTL